MFRFFKAFERTLFVALKLLLIVLMFVVFFLVYRGDSPELQRGFNRVSAIISSTFVVVFYIMLRAYGGLAFGKKRTRELILSVAMVAFITDVFTYIQFCIMEKRIMAYWKLIPIYVIQCLAAILIVKITNDLYFKINPPKKLLIIHNNEEKLAIVLEKLKAYQNRFCVEKIMNVGDAEMHRSIRSVATVMLIDLPSDKKEYIVGYCYKRNKEVFLTPEISDILINNADHEIFDDISMFGYTKTGLSFEQRLYKRIIDLVLTVPAVIILTPLMILEAVAIKIEDGGKVFYKQERATEGGRLFNVLKFRTMIENAETNGAVLASENDGRITRVGSFLRKTRLDEIPQLFNIIAGDMSIVGPRPERQELAEEYEKDLPEFSYRLRVKAGLTGLAQIRGRYTTSPEDKLVLDLIYIDKYSLRLDLKIMFQTLLVILSPEKSK